MHAKKIPSDSINSVEINLTQMFLQLSIQDEEKNLKIREKDCVKLDLLVEFDTLCGEKN